MPTQSDISRIMAEFGRRGGSATSAAKAAASAANGAKGGRPPLPLNKRKTKPRKKAA